MSYDTEHYYAVQTFLEDDELCKIWNIIEIAMNREGYDVSNSELSLRLYDSELLDDFEDLFEVYDIIGEIKNEYEKKLEIAQAKQPKAEW